MISALTILFLVLPLPIVFLLHVAEEAFVQHVWILRHREAMGQCIPCLRTVFPVHWGLSTKAFLIAVVEEFVVMLVVTAYVLVRGPWCTELWSVVFMAFVLRIVVRVVQAIAMRGYVPGLVTSVLLLPYACLGVGSLYSHFSIAGFVLIVLAGCAFAALNLRLAHWVGVKSASKRS